MNAEQQQSVKQFLTNKRDSAITLEEKGNQLGAYYLSCIAGMWSQTAGFDEPIFDNASDDLQSWYFSGREAAREAGQQNEKLRALWAKKEKADAEKRKKKGFRLW